MKANIKRESIYTPIASTHNKHTHTHTPLPLQWQGATFYRLTLARKILKQAKSTNKRRNKKL